MCEVLDLDNITYEEYIKDFIVYPTWKAARKIGYEAHHIVPVAVQQSAYVERTGNKIDRNTIRSSDFFDDRCFSCTSLEHIIIHYLLARDKGGLYLNIFYNMYRKNHVKLSDINKIKLNELTSWSSTIEAGKKAMIEKKKQYFKNQTAEERAARIEASKIAGNNAKSRERKSNSRKEYYRNLSSEDYIKYCEDHKKIYTSEARQHLSEGHKLHYQNSTAEEKEAFHQRCIKSAAEKAPRFQRRRQVYLEKIKSNEFTGSWNEFQVWCRLENEKIFEEEFKKVQDQKISRTSFYREWKKRAPY